MARYQRQIIEVAEYRKQNIERQSIEDIISKDKISKRQNIERKISNGQNIERKISKRENIERLISKRQNDELKVSKEKYRLEIALCGLLRALSNSSDSLFCRPQRAMSGSMTDLEYSGILASHPEKIA